MKGSCVPVNNLPLYKESAPGRHLVRMSEKLPAGTTIFVTHSSWENVQGDNGKIANKHFARFQAKGNMYWTLVSHVPKLTKPLW